MKDQNKSTKSRRTFLQTVGGLGTAGYLLTGVPSVAALSNGAERYVGFTYHPFTKEVYGRAHANMVTKNGEYRGVVHLGNNLTFSFDRDGPDQSVEPNKISPGYFKEGGVLNKYLSKHPVDDAGTSIKVKSIVSPANICGFIQYPNEEVEAFAIGRVSFFGSNKQAEEAMLQGIGSPVEQQ